MNLLRFSEDKIHFRKYKICFYHITQRGHKGSRRDPLRLAAKWAAGGAFGVDQPHGTGDPSAASTMQARVCGGSGAVGCMRSRGNKLRLGRRVAHLGSQSPKGVFL
jgi:hypothetical protein